MTLVRPASGEFTGTIPQSGWRAWASERADFGQGGVIGDADIRLALDDAALQFLGPGMVDDETQMRLLPGQLKQSIGHQVRGKAFAGRDPDKLTAAIAVMADLIQQIGLFIQHMLGMFAQQLARLRQHDAL